MLGVERDSSVPLRVYCIASPLPLITRANEIVVEIEAAPPSSRSGPDSWPSMYGASTPADACDAPPPSARVEHG